MDNQYNYKETQERLQKLWNDKGVYAPDMQAKKRYSIDTPPPTVSGSLHIGHIFSYTQTDIIARYKRMNGYSVFYPFGFDDNGLPTEKFVEKKENIQAHTLSRSEFIARCLTATHDIEQLFKELWQTIGLSVDWDYSYSTISESTRRLSQLSFINLYNKGYVYRKNEPALYCPMCRTTVAQAELDDIEMSSHFTDIVFKDDTGKDLVIGTTRPELLPSCVALLYHPEDKRYQYLQGRRATVPLFGNEVPLIADELVVPEKGTGLVMCCTFGDTTDIAWFKKHNLPYRQSIGVDGRFMSHAGIIAGLKIHEARKKIIEALRESGLVRDQKEIVHTVNVHERCKKEIEFIVVPQWFIAVLPYKKELLALADKIEWFPYFMKSRYINWVENLSWDWCISRQRFFGIPFPVWHCNNCASIIIAPETAIPVDPQEQSSLITTCAQCGSHDLKPDTDVMDTWNTSSITPYMCRELFNQTKDNPFTQTDIDFLPMSMRPQAHDIIRTWAFYTIAKVWMHHKTIAWDTIVISGHVLATSKEKLSKSKGNASLTPEKLLETYSADVIRYWTASGNLGHDVAFSEQQLKIGGRLTTKLWNAFIFVGTHITAQVKPELPEYKGAVNEWLLHNAAETYQQYKNFLDVNEFGLALNVIEKFFWHCFCDNYLELIKDQLFNSDKYSEKEVNATRATLYHVGLSLLQWYAPYLPYITDALYQKLYKITEKHESIHSTYYDAIQTLHSFSDSAVLVDRIIMIVTAVRKLKSEHKISLKVPFKAMTISGISQKERLLLSNYEQLIKGVTHAEVIVYEDTGLITALCNEADNWYATIGL